MMLEMEVLERSLGEDSQWYNFFIYISVDEL